MKNENQIISEDTRNILAALKQRIPQMTHDLSPTLVRLYAPLDGATLATWAAIGKVKYRSNKGTRILLRRFDPNATTTRLPPAENVRFTPQGLWVTTDSEAQTVAILKAHFTDIKKRIETGRPYGIKVLDNRSYKQRGRKTEGSSPRSPKN